jgi:hypothetical protein
MKFREVTTLNLESLVADLYGWLLCTAYIRSENRLWVATWRTTGQEWVPGPGDSRSVAGSEVVTLIEILEAAWG